ncbi:MAG: hypothetical protein BYD32DRAFT_426587 [Podila humilis]|nr:MAG: hypothetical protein BYD32DRAFT_426587 [Podila humilis]
MSGSTVHLPIYLLLIASFCLYPTSKVLEPPPVCLFVFSFDCTVANTLNSDCFEERKRRKENKNKRRNGPSGYGMCTQNEPLGCLLAGLCRLALFFQT